MHLFSVEIHGQHGFLHSLTVFESCGTKGDIVGVPLSETTISMIRRLAFVDDCCHAVLGLVTVEHLNFVPVLQVDPTIASCLWDEKFNVKSKVSVCLFRDNIGGPVHASCGCRVVGDHGVACVHRILADFPLDGERGSKSRAFPVSPFLIQ